MHVGNELSIDTTPQPLAIGAAGDAELAQNVRLIVSTFACSVRFDVPFADVGDYIDSPLPLATARRIAGLAEAIERHEPRLRVVSITFRDEPVKASQGIGYPVITVARRS
ncbi:GPW/gp25 family protein [Megalodesulfovibrio paquesii]